MTTPTATPEDGMVEEEADLKVELQTAVTRLGHKGSILDLQHYARMGKDLRATNEQGQNFVCVVAQRDLRRNIEANSVEIISWLVDQGVEVDHPDRLQQTALFYSATNGAEMVATELIKRRAAVNHRDIHQQTALFYAATKGQVNVLRCLIRHNADTWASDVSHQNPLFYATAHGHVAAASALFSSDWQTPPAERTNVRDRWGRTALYQAADPQCCELLLARNADLNVLDVSRQSPLFLAARFGQGQKVRYLIEANMDPTVVDRNTQTALFYAAREGHEEVVHILLHMRVDPDLRDVNQQTALFYSSQTGHPDVLAKLLTSAGVMSTSPPPVTTTNASATAPTLGLEAGALHPAAASPPKLANGKGNSSSKSQGQSPSAASPTQTQSTSTLRVPGPGQGLASPPSSVPLALLGVAERAQYRACQQDARGMTPLFEAFDLATCKVLLEHKCNPDIQGLHRESVLFRAAAAGQTARVSLLLRFRSDPRVRDVRKRTPLFAAAEAGHHECARLLIHVGGADVRVKDHRMQTPANIALAKGHVELSQEIQQWGRASRKPQGQPAGEVDASPGPVARKVPAQSPLPQERNVRPRLDPAVYMRGIIAPPRAASKAQAYHYNQRPLHQPMAAAVPPPGAHRYRLSFADPSDPTGETELPEDSEQHQNLRSQLMTLLERVLLETPTSTAHADVELQEKPGQGSETGDENDEDEDEDPAAGIKVGVGVGAGELRRGSLRADEGSGASSLGEGGEGWDEDDTVAESAGASEGVQANETSLGSDAYEDDEDDDHEFKAET